MTELVAILNSIPNVVWSGLIASALTLGGVLVANWSNTNRLKLQLQHDSVQKASDRTATLRREVYLTAAEELTKANVYLASLPQADLTKTKTTEGLQGFFAAAAKLQLIAEPATALLVNQLAADYGELLLRVLAAVMPLQKLRSDIQISSDLYEKEQTEIRRILAEMAKFNESAQTEARIFEALQSGYEFHAAQAEKFNSERNRHWTQFNKLNMEFCKEIAREIQQLGDLQIPALVAMRSDLGLTGEIDIYRAQMQANAKRMTRGLEAFIETLKTS